jgi:hypothetical protein
MTRSRLLVLVLLAALAAPAVAHASASGVVVSQVYGGGGNSGATFKNDFVELFNAGTAPVDVTGWTVQYATSAGTSWQRTALSGTIQPGRYYLVQEDSSADVGAALPLSDAAGAINLAASSGKVALVRGDTALECGAAPGSCAVQPLLEDLIGYGTAVDYEGGAAAPTLSSTLAAVRAGNGCTDTNSNSSDFASSPPVPRNSVSPAVFCAAEPPPPPPPPPPVDGASSDASVAVEIDRTLSISLERSALDFGRLGWNTTPEPIGDQVTVVSNDPAGYVLSVHRTAFAPGDLPLAIGGSAPPGGELGAALAGNALAPVPIAPSPDLVVGTTAAETAAAGDVWPTRIGFASPLPFVRAGRYTATLTFTVVGR